jgi:hypothetical protein
VGKSLITPEPWWALEGDFDFVLVDEQPVVYCQFGPLSAYPRARRLRELYSQLPDAPPPAVTPKALPEKSAKARKATALARAKPVKKASPGQAASVP